MVAEQDARLVPVALRGPLGYPEQLPNLRERESAEEFQVDDLRQARLIDTESLERLGDLLELLAGGCVRHFSRQGGDLEGGTAFLRAAAAHEVDEKTPHCAAGIREEAGAVGEHSARPRGQVQIRFVEQRS